MTTPDSAPWDVFRPGGSRIVCGIMSGTSLDGADAVVARLSGSGRTIELEILGAGQAAYPAELREALLANSADETSAVSEISQLNARLPLVYAEAVRAATDNASIATNQVQVIGNHGQTIHHLPEPVDCGGIPTRSTLQIGDSSVLANLLGIPVVGDFRLPDMALSGQGAPLVPYFDWVVFSSDSETRGLLNLGGIANMTTLPARGGLEDVRAFDTGPANMVMDSIAQSFFGIPFDTVGKLGASGAVVEPALEELLAHPYFRMPPPKTTGRELFGDEFAQRLVTLVRDNLPQNASDEEVGRNALATAAALTCRSIHLAYRDHLSSESGISRLVISGGGTQNVALMARLASLFSPIPIETTDVYGIPSKCKEPLCFAVLAHEFLNGVPTNVPSVTGASAPALLGKLSLPYRGSTN